MIPKLKLLALLLLFAAFPLSAQTPVVLAPAPVFQAWTSSGLPLAFGCVFTYQSQTTTALATYTDFTGTFQNSNPVLLSASGTANIWIKAGQAYTLVVKTAGGTNCALGTTRYTVDGVGGGQSTLTTIITPSGGTATFADQAQNQLFTLTLTGNVVGQPITGVGIVPPGFITFQITQDAVGSRTFSWPANAVNPATICSAANCVTTQTFVWNGTKATAIGAASYSTNVSGIANLIDFGLSASFPICTDVNKQLSSTCAGLIPNSALANSSVTYNGQAVALGATGNVNAGAAAHSMTLNQGNGSAETGLALTDDQVPTGRTGADPVAASVPNCASGLTYNTSTHAYGCSAASVVGSATVASCTLGLNSAITNGEWNCSATFAWGATLPSSTYKIACTLSQPQPPGSYFGGGGGGGQADIFYGTKSTTGFVYWINDDHSGSNGATYNIDCIAVQ